MRKTNPTVERVRTDSFAAIEPVYENDAGRILVNETEVRENCTASRIEKQTFDQDTDLRIPASAVARSTPSFGFSAGIGRS